MPNAAGTLSYPVDDIKLVIRACNPAEPLPPGDERWYDFGALRGSRVLDQLENLLGAPPASGNFHHGVLCGHRGTGKSTELLHLKDWADRNGFLAVRTEVDVYLGQISLEFSDLYLLTVMAVEDTLKGMGITFPKDQAQKVVGWFAEVTKENKSTVQSELAVEAGAQLDAGVPFLGRLFAKFSAAVKAGSQHALTVRQRLRNFPDTLVDFSNELLNTANASLRAKGHPKGVLLIFDNLDRYDPEHIDRVLMKGSTLMRRLAAHAIYTMPIALEYAPLSGPIQDEYGLALVLPMLALRRREHDWKSTVAASPYEEPAVVATLEALKKRIAVDKLFDDQKDAELLVRMSGGCVRDLLHLVTLAFQRAGAKFTHSAVVEAIQQYRSTFVRRLTPDDYNRLAQVARRQAVPRDELTARLLYNRFALEYTQNGEAWIDVHPLVVEAEDFQRALKS